MERIKDCDGTYEYGFAEKHNSLDSILIEARKKTEKNIDKAFRLNDTGSVIKYLRAYRMFTKLLNRELLNIFDF